MTQLQIPWEIVDGFLPDWAPPADAGILITHSHYTWEDLSTLRRIYETNRVPILILCDGILEYRNTWAHPKLPDGSMFQPVMGHKLACLGRAPARILESWGNVGKCEIVGLPRLDHFFSTTPPPIRPNGPWRLLVTTAMTPAFDDQQFEITLASLRALKQKLDSMPKISGRPIEVNWRLTGGIAANLGLPEVDLRQAPSLLDSIDQADAVVTTPSTIFLESAIRKRPTALLDFHNCPQYLTPAWQISAVSQIEGVLHELVTPPPAKLLFQETALHDQLECRTPAQERLVRLIETMVEIGRKASMTHSPLQFPARILTDEQCGFTHVPAEFNLASLFEKNEAFQQKDLQRMQVELSAAIASLGTLPLELAERQQHIALANGLIEQAKIRNRDMHIRLNKVVDELTSIKKRHHE
jgi:hypothetical protein